MTITSPVRESTCYEAETRINSLWVVKTPISGRVTIGTGTNGAALDLESDSVDILFGLLKSVLDEEAEEEAK